MASSSATTSAMFSRTSSVFTKKSSTTTTVRSSAISRKTTKASASSSSSSSSKKKEQKQQQQQQFLGIASTSLLLAATPLPASASELTEKLAGFLDAVDAASETVAGGVSQTVEVAKQVKEAYDEAVPVVTPYAERAIEAAKPLGDAAGGLANKYVAPVASDVISKASTGASGVVTQASGALKQQGVDVAPVVSVVETTGKSAVDAALPIGKQALEYVSTASAGELGLLAIGAYVAYLILPGVLGVFAGAARGYAGDVGALEAYELVLSGNTNIIDLRSENDKAKSGPNPPKGRVLEVDAKGESVEVTALKVSAMNGVGKGKKYIIVGGNSKGFAKALKNKGFNKVFVLKGGYGAWRNAGLP
jgi:rhodanese-related sulfurtransferase